MSSLYRSLYRRLGGRPWTHISWDSLRAHPNWWVFGLGAGGIALGSAAQELWDWRVTFFLISFLAIGYVLGHIYWCGRTLLQGRFGMKSHRQWWGAGLACLGAVLGYWASGLWDWEVVFFILPLLGIGFVLGHIFWCERPVGLGRLYS